MKKLSFAIALLLAFLADSASLRAQSLTPGSALSFNGVNQYVSFPNDTANPYPLTVTCWIKTSDNNTNSEGIVNKYVSGSLSGWNIFLLNGEVRAWYIKDFFDNVFDGSSGLNGGLIADGAWHHIAFSVDGTGGKLYVDGTLKSSRPWNGSPSATGTTQPISLAYNAGLGSGAFLTGQVDEVQIWSTSLTQTQIQSNKNRSLTGSESGLYYYYRLDEGSGGATANAAASTGAAYSGQLLNGPAWVTSTIPFAPVAFSSNATSVSASGANLNGSAIPNNLPTIAYCRWGTDTSYGNVTTNRSLGSGSAATNFTFNLNGLLPVTTYHYQVVASNSVGISSGADISFTTFTSHPPSATTLAASNFVGTTATLNGSVNPNGSPTTAWFELALEGWSNQMTAPFNPGFGTSAVPVSVGVTGLTAGANYHYRLIATNFSGVRIGVPMHFWQPLVSLKGANPITVGFDAPYADPGATVSAYPAAVAAGAFHSVALKADATPVAWGAGTFNDPSDEADFGQSIIPANATNIVSIAAGQYFCLGLRADGALLAWGDNSDGQCNIPAAASNVVAIAAGLSHGLALRADGTIVAWGDNTYGQLNIPAAATNLLAIAAGQWFSLAQRMDGNVFAWGDNNENETVVPVTATNIVAIAAGYFQCLALRADGRVIAWGDNSYGETTIPSSASNVVAIASGFAHSLALRMDGHVIAWGDNTFGQLQVPASATNVVAISAGLFHSLAIKADGTVLAWGSGTNDNPGDGLDYGQCIVPAGLSAVSLPMSTIGSVNTNIPGNYVLMYSATNTSGVVGSTTRTVKVLPLGPLGGRMLPAHAGFQLSFSGATGTNFDVLSTTNVALPLSKWTLRGSAQSGPVNHYQFTDTQATNGAKGFYTIRAH